MTQPSSPVAGSRSVMQYGSPAGSVSTVQNSSLAASTSGDALTRKTTRRR